MKIRSNSELDPTERAADGRERGALERGGLPHELVVRGLRRRMNIELNFPPSFEGLVLGCIDADFCK